jgi:hypothetical protein
LEWVFANDILLSECQFVLLKIILLNVILISLILLLVFYQLSHHHSTQNAILLVCHSIIYNETQNVILPIVIQVINTATKMPFCQLSFNQLSCQSKSYSVHYHCANYHCHLNAIFILPIIMVPQMPLN